MLGVGASQSLAVQFTPTDTANINKATASVAINVLNAPPTISSVSASPNPATVGDIVILFAAASDINDTLTYSWAFGDGTSGTGASVSHKYAIGTFAAFVTVTDLSGATVTSSVTVKVNPLPNTSEDSIPGNSPAVLDTDGDGFPDQLEVVNGTSASNAKDTPTGSPAGPPLLLPDAKLAIKLNFAKAGSDSIGLAGTLILPAGSITGKKLSVTIGGVAKSFTLDGKGGAKVGGDSVKVASKGLSSRTGKFAVKLSKGTFAAMLSGYGLTSTVDVKSAPVSVPIVLLFANTLYEKNQAQLYTAKAGKTGATKDKK